MARRHSTIRVLATASVLGLVGTGCGDDASPGLDEITTPTFEVDDTGEPSGTGGDASDQDSPTGDAPDPSAPTGGDAPDPSTSVVVGGGDDAGPPLERVAFNDPVGDATPGVGTDEPPPWSDLAGGALERRGDAYALAVRLGGAAPERAPGSETMNIASFYDVDGDGAIEYEIWVNLGPDGWGPVWYDDRGNAVPGEESNVTVEVEGDEVRLLFPGVMLGSPSRLRFSLASEYGELSVIGSSFARRDDAPDDDQAVSFPG